MTSFSRRSICRALATVPLLSATLVSRALAQASQGRNPQAERFVQAQAQRILTVLADKRLSESDKRRAFRQAIDEVVDVPRVTGFVLGKYSRAILPGQRQAFAVAFRDYAEGVYQSRLGDYHGETLKVVGSLVRKPGDVVVNTTIIGGKISAPLQVGWRVIAAADGWRVIDVQVKGVWLAITQQQDFVSTIDNAGGDVGVLTAQLQRDAVRGDRR
ncbi:MAG: ABC transporter substrate-binding protein [Alphaproteobacteria bacterium]|nr:ABC transporter substrate-binding protein [Alphaproteobacteria bacterium]